MGGMGCVFWTGFLFFCLVPPMGPILWTGFWFLLKLLTRGMAEDMAPGIKHTDWRWME